MALRKKTDDGAGAAAVETGVVGTATATTAAPAAVQEAVATTAAAPAAELVQETAAQAVAQAAAPAPAVQQTHAVAVSRNPMPAGMILDDCQDKFVADFGTLPRLKASNGNILDDKDKLLGDYIDLQIMSWNFIHVVGPCDNKAPAELVRYSYDNQTFDDGSGLTVTDWIADLKAQDWPNASSKKYGEVVAMLVGAAKPTELVGQLVQVQLSPTSLRAFEGFRLQQTFKISQGLVDPGTANLMRFAVEVVTAKSNTWSKFSPTAIPAAA